MNWRLRRIAACVAGALIGAALTGGSAVAAVDGSGSRIVTKKQYGKRWPFTVARGLLSCRDSAVTFTARGRIYGINGTALGRGFKRVDPIWRKSSDPLAGPRINIGPILDRGLKLCD